MFDSDSDDVICDVYILEYMASHICNWKYIACSYLISSITGPKQHTHTHSIVLLCELCELKKHVHTMSYVMCHSSVIVMSHSHININIK